LKHNNDFRFDLEIGKSYETQLAELIGQRIEVKRDFKALETGNIFIEYESRGKPSGLATTQADYWCYWLSDEHCILIKTEKLKELCRKFLYTNRDVLGGDSNTSKGILLPTKKFIEL
jgi:hypothetical protein